MHKILPPSLLIGIILFSMVPAVSPHSTAAEPATNSPTDEEAGPSSSNLPVDDGAPGDIIVDSEMRINLVLIGDTWSEEDKTEITDRLLQSYVPMIASEERPIGVRYNFTYDFSSEPEDVADGLFEFIDSVAVEAPVPFPIEQWMFIRQPTLRSEDILYKQINAFHVDEKLAELEQKQGYTVYFLKPTRQQLGYTHTYGVLSEDPDTKRVFVQEGMMGFGGKSRFYFVDLSAGPWRYPFVPVSETEFVSEFHKNIEDVETAEEYHDLIAEYVREMTMLLFTPSYLYAPVYKSNYRMEVFLIDMTAGRTLGDLSEKYLDREVIEEAFAKLIPYAEWTSEITGQSFDSLPRELQRAVLRSLSFQKTGGGDLILVKSSEFITELRSWLEGTLTEEELRLIREEAETTVFVPIILFVFDTDAFVDQVPVVGSAIPEPSDNSVPCCAIVAVDKHALLDFGTGLSTLAVHEMGHVIGLRHPHDGFSETDGEFTSWLFDWSYTPMTYASPGIFGCGVPAERCGLVITEFGQFNLDTIDRGLVLSVLQQAETSLFNATSQLTDKGYEEDTLPEEIRSKLSSIDSDVKMSKDLFSAMNYFNFTAASSPAADDGGEEGGGSASEIDDDALDFALRAQTGALSLLEDVGNLPEVAPKTLAEYGVNALDVSGPLLIDENGVESRIHEIMEPIEIRSTVAANISRQVNFTAIIQIRDGNGYTVSLTPLSYLVSSGSDAEPMVSWMFERPGEFYVEVFLWTGLDDPAPLSDVKAARVTLVA